MKDQKFQPLRFIYLAFLSFFGTGFSPKAPGTVGSLATIPLIYALGYFQVSFLWVLISTIVLTIVAGFIAEYIQQLENVQDPGWIVIDEVIGMLVGWLFVFPAIDAPNLILVFIFFRFFDIIKVYPANWFDKKVKNGFGTIIDDVISGFYAGICVLLCNYLQLTAF